MGPITPQEIAAAAGNLLQLHERVLLDLEQRLSAGICQRGARRGAPLERGYRRRLECWADRVRNAIAYERRVLATAEALALRGVSDAGWLIG